MTGRVRVLLVTTAIVGSVAGCGGPTAPPATSQAPTTSDSSSAPPISDPIDVTKYISDPCGLLSKQTITSVGVSSETAVKDEPGVNAKTCTWGGSTPSVHAFVNNSVSLAGQYQKQKMVQSFKYFIPTNVEGYPAIYSDTIDRRKEGDWSIEIGMNDKNSAVVSVDYLRNPEKAKPALDRLAKEVVGKLKGGK